MLLGPTEAWRPILDLRIEEFLIGDSDHPNGLGWEGGPASTRGIFAFVPKFAALGFEGAVDSEFPELQWVSEASIQDVGLVGA